MAKNTAELDIYDDMNFYTTADSYIFEPNGKNDILLIDRINGDVHVQAKSNQVHQMVPTRRVCGVLGVIKLIAGKYIIVATHRVFVGLVNGQVIWRLAGYDIVPFSPSLNDLTPQQKDQNEAYLGMLRKVLDTPFLYFSYTYDLTHTLQRLHSMLPESFNNSHLERADQRFVWNGFILRNFNNNELKRFLLPLVLGFVSINQVIVNGHSLLWTIISRRTVYRAGPRFFCRGIDEKGNCANFVETEQIIEYNGERVSFVQTRGSIPIFWRQMPNIKYKPPIEIESGKENLLAAGRHFDEQLLNYGQQVLINLINQTGAESILEVGYRSIISQLNNPSIRYEAFDFHHECRKMRWDRLNILIDRLAHEQDEFNVFHLRRDGMLLSSQSGVFRTNCIDCLDRTNVVQSMLAKRSLTLILTKLGILRPGQKIENTAVSFEAIFKNVWADNADLISIQYSGTGALKTDFTRTGKRTKAGLIQDGVNSLTRYYYNNFLDGFRQDAMNLFLGKYIVQHGEGSLVPCPLVIQKGWKYGTFPSVLMIAIAMFFASSIFPHEYNTENLLFLLFWGAMVGVTASGIIKYGVEFVDWPKLLPPVKIEP